MDEGSFMWIDMKQFKVFDNERSDAELLEALVADANYRDDYAGPFHSQGQHELHGPYHVEAITSDVFVRTTAEDAVSAIQTWADGRQDSEETQKLMREQVLPMFADAVLYRLPDLRSTAEHEYGFVVGSGEGFNEFVSIRRAEGELTLIVASDD